jgi:hypothetical protein
VRMNHLLKVSIKLGMDRSRGHQVNATHSVFSILLTASQFNVSIITPFGSPRVFNNPILLAIFFAVSDGEHAVVQAGVTIRIIKDTRFIKLK